jgi:hypothetical protein
VGAVTVRLAGWIIVSEALSTTQELNTKLNMVTNDKLTMGAWMLAFSMLSEKI